MSIREIVQKILTEEEYSLRKGDKVRTPDGVGEVYSVKKVLIVKLDGFDGDFIYDPGHVSKSDGSGSFPEVGDLVSTPDGSGVVSLITEVVIVYLDNGDRVHYHIEDVEKIV